MDRLPLAASGRCADNADDCRRGVTPTEARSPRKDPPKRPIHGPNYHPPYAAIVIDDKSGFVLHEVSPDEPRHPASLTKIMTLYLLFEQLEAGKLSLDTE